MYAVILGRVLSTSRFLVANLRRITTCLKKSKTVTPYSLLNTFLSENGAFILKVQALTLDL